ncbi:MAG: hypothetical protein M1823_001671 [Watsoniomyces obsoletus]|nr:MAG: hypothetical protein M1823_001671 [Watsoniomyces obsoletus]
MARHPEDDEGNASPTTSTESIIEPQAGVKKVEAVSLTWTKWGLISAYIGIFLIAFSTSLEGQTVLSLSIYATSSFQKHSMLAVVFVVQGIINAVIKPPMAKIADVFGRLESFSFAICLYVLGYIQMAASRNIQAYAAAQIFYAAGFQGLQILQQIFVADTSDLLNRALFISLPVVPFLITVWIGPSIADSILKHSTWRWGYGIWTIIVPVAFLPLAISLSVNYRRAAKRGRLPISPWKGKKSIMGILTTIAIELDLMGLLLLSAALSLILIPLNLAATAKSGWRNPSILAMLILGAIFAISFIFWESQPQLARKPVLSLRLLRQRTVLAGCGIAFFYFMAFYLSVQPYFNSYLQVVQNDSITAAGRITQVFSFTSTATAILTGLSIRFLGRYKYFVVLGSCIYVVALGLMIRYRSEESSRGSIIGGQIALGIGGGMITIPTQLGIQASASHAEVASATAIFLTLLETGGAVGAAISGAIWTANVPGKLRLYLPKESKERALEIFGSLEVAKSFKMGTEERRAINRAYQETMHLLLIVAICVAAPLVPLSFGLRDYRLKEMDQHVKGHVIGSSRRGRHHHRDDDDEDSLDS